jgi:hypothetical protein
LLIGDHAKRNGEAGILVSIKQKFPMVFAHQ